MRQMKVKITTLSPIVLTVSGNSTVMTETFEAISGSMLRGVLANQYIRAKALGNEAHEDESFRRLFFGGLRFVDANPVLAEDAGECRSFRLPFSLQKEKSKGEEPPKIHDLIWHEGFPEGMKSFRGYGVMRDGRIQTVSIRKDISMHMSRMSDRERRLGRSKDGGIYNYESLEAGQVFAGLILGEEEDLRVLCGAVPQTVDCRIGRSRFAQYGHCRLELGQIEEVHAPCAEDLHPAQNAMILRLDTPFLPETTGDVMMTAGNALAMVAGQMNRSTGSGAFSVRHIHAAADEIGNYVDVWGMKRPRESALAAGTVFALAKEGEWTAQDFEALSALMHGGIGRRTEEGFGQLCLWPEPQGVYEKTRKQVREEKEEALASLPQMSAEVAETARNIFARRLQEKMRVYAAEDVKEMPAGLAGLTHFFGRLDQMLMSVGAGEGNREAYSRLLQEKIRPRSQLERNLHAVVVKGRALYDILREKRELPYEKRDWKTDLSGRPEKTAACMRAIGLDENAPDWKDGAYFYEYWHWFFRYARKKASTSQRKEAGTHE